MASDQERNQQREEDDKEVQIQINGGDQPETEQPVTEESTTETPSVEQLTLMLEDARGKVDDQHDQLIRARAELDNLRKRHQRDLENAHKFAIDGFVKDLLAVWDSMELGIAAARAEGADIARIVEGTELTLKLFTGVMGKFNVEQVNPEGEPFNPDLHQAMSMVPRDDVPPNTVVLVLQRGYTLNGRLVRPALVGVSRAMD